MAVGLSENVKKWEIRPGGYDDCSSIFWNRMKYLKRNTEDKNEEKPPITPLNNGSGLSLQRNAWGEKGEVLWAATDSSQPLRWIHDIFNKMMADSVAISGRYNRRRLDVAAVGT